MDDDLYEAPRTKHPVVVAVSGDAIQATIWRDALADAGITAAVVERGMSAALGGATSVSATYHVLVDREAVGDARNVIAELGGAMSLAPLPDDATAAQRRRAALIAAAVAAVAVLVAIGLLQQVTR